MKVVNSNRFHLQGTNKAFLHLATVHHNAREFMCFAQIATSVVFIEEISGGSLLCITDDALHFALNEFLTNGGFITMGKPLVPDKEWLYENK